MRWVYRSSILLSLTACLGSPGVAQDTFLAFLGFPPSIALPASTVLQDTSQPADTAKQGSLPLQADQRIPSRGYESTKSPALAVMLSAVLPGTGQLYNEDYWKTPVIWALGGYWAYEWYSLNKRYMDFRDQYQQSVKSSPPLGNTQLQRVRDFYRDERDKFAWYLGVLYFANLLDAYIGANLYDFNVSSDLSTDGTFVPRVTASIRIIF